MLAGYGRQLLRSELLTDSLAMMGDMDALAAATVALATGTFALGWVAWRTLQLQRTQTQRAHRPVIVPGSSARTVHFRSGELRDAPAGPAMHEGKLVVAVENVGMGPALNVRGIVECGGAASAHGSGRTLHPVEGIASGAANAVTFTPDDGHLEPQIEVWARLAYEDVAGETYWTDLHYNVSAKGYRSRAWGPTSREEPSTLPTRRRLQDVLPLQVWTSRPPG